MARTSLSNSHQKLNLSRRQTLLFQHIILTGNRMVTVLNRPEVQATQPKYITKLHKTWGKLMVDLVKMILF